MGADSVGTNHAAWSTWLMGAMVALSVGAACVTVGVLFGQVGDVREQLATVLRKLDEVAATTTTTQIAVAKMQGQLQAQHADSRAQPWVASETSR